MFLAGDKSTQQIDVMQYIKVAVLVVVVVFALFFSGKINDLPEIENEVESREILITGNTNEGGELDSDKVVIKGASLNHLNSEE